MIAIMDADPCVWTAFQITLKTRTHEIVQVYRSRSTPVVPASDCPSGVRKAKLSASHIGVFQPPGITTNRAPRAVEEDLKPTLVVGGTSNETESSYKSRRK